MKHIKLYESISGDEYHHRGNGKTQTLIIPNEIGDFDSNDVYASIESLSGGEMDERDFVEGELYNIRVVDQDGDDESFDATFKLKKEGDKLSVSDILKDDVMESVRVSESKRFKYLKTFESFSISENLVTDQDKEMTLNIFAPVSVVVDIEDGVVTNFSGDEIEREGINSFGEKDFQEAFEPFEKAGVKVSYTPWRSEGGDDYEGSYSIDVPSLNDAIKNKKITIIVDPEDPEEYLEIKNK